MQRCVVGGGYPKASAAALLDDGATAVVLNRVPFPDAAHSASQSLLLVSSRGGPPVPHSAEYRTSDLGSNEVAEFTEKPVRPLGLPLGRPLQYAAGYGQMLAVVDQLPSFVLVSDALDRILKLEGEERLINHALMHLLDLLPRVGISPEVRAVGQSDGMHSPEVPVDHVIVVQESL